MSYRWIIFAVAATLLGVGAWYFGRPIHPKEAPEDKRVAVAATADSETPKQLPPKLIEVIDLTSAYEPVREQPTVTPGDVDPASFIEDQSAPSRIPYAVDEDDPFADVLRVIQDNTPTSPFILGAGINSDGGVSGTAILVDGPRHFEKIVVMPREVHVPTKLNVMPREVK